MESRSFIRAATALIGRINVSSIGAQTIEEENAKLRDIQKDINQTFLGLQNPTLPSAAKLRDAALEYGFQVDQRMLTFIARGEQLWHF